MLALLGGIAAAYAALHAQGVLHGDVHPRNLLVDGWGKVTPIDFGLARLADEPDAANLRGGATFYTDPGFAAAVMAGRAPPGLDAVAEQFSLCALLYHLATGRHYVDFDLQSERMLQQIVESRPRPFAALDRPSWPDLEATLARGLEKAPEDRFGDTAQLAAALASIVPPTAATKLDATPLRAECRSFVDDLVRELDFDSRLFRDGLAPPPTASVSFGAAGVAYGMLRLAGARLQPELTATADAWLLRARRTTATADAFANEGMDVRPETIGPISPYHTLSGVHLVGALLADAMADGPAVDAGVEAFLDASAVPCSGRDVTLGRAGTALASLLALEGLAQLGDEPRQGLRACAEARLVQLWAELPPAETVANSASWPNLGVAHGWAGLLYVTLRWLASLEEPGAHPLAESVRSRLEELADCAWPSGRGMALPWRDRPGPSEASMPGWCNGAAGLVHVGCEARRVLGDERYLELAGCAWQSGRGMALPWRDRPGPSEASMPGWCNGAAGLVHVGCEARRVLGDERYLELAERAAWQAWESESLAIDLCCGLGGRAYALLELHRCGGGAAWRRKAERLALGAVRAAPEQRNAEHPRHSLLKGELGLALLCADLERPEVAAMPFFGREPLAIHHGQGGIERPGSRSGLQEEP